jgi:hypothetical protein
MQIPPPVSAHLYVCNQITKVSVACPSLVYWSMAEAFINVEAAAAGLSGPLLLLLPAEHKCLFIMHMKQ